MFRTVPIVEIDRFVMRFEDRSQTFFDQMIRFVETFGGERERIASMMKFDQLTIGDGRTSEISRLVENRFQIVGRVLLLRFQPPIDRVDLRLRKADEQRLDERKFSSSSTRRWTYARIHRESRMKFERPAKKFASIFDLSAAQFFGENVEKLQGRETSRLSSTSIFSPNSWHRCSHR